MVFPPPHDACACVACWLRCVRERCFVCWYSSRDTRATGTCQSRRLCVQPPPLPCSPSFLIPHATHDAACGKRLPLHKYSGPTMGCFRHMLKKSRHSGTSLSSLAPAHWQERQTGAARLHMICPSKCHKQFFLALRSPEAEATRWRRKKAFSWWSIINIDGGM